MSIKIHPAAPIKSQTPTTSTFAARMASSPLFHDWVVRTLASSSRDDAIDGYLKQHGINPEHLDGAAWAMIDRQFPYASFKEKAQKAANDHVLAEATVRGELAGSGPLRDPFSALFTGPAADKAAARAKETIVYEDAHHLVVADILKFNPFSPHLLVIPKTKVGDPLGLNDAPWDAIEALANTVAKAMKASVSGAAVKVFVHSPSERTISQLHIHVECEKPWSNAPHERPAAFIVPPALTAEAAAFYKTLAALLSST